jgi:hypothetical protein
MEHTVPTDAEVGASAFTSSHIGNSSKRKGSPNANVEAFRSLHPIGRSRKAALNSREPQQ